MTLSTDEVWKTLREADCLHDKTAVDAALDSMAKAITLKLGETNPLILTVMNGGMIVSSEILLRLRFPLDHDYLHATRYRGKTQGGELNWIARPTHSLKDRVVLLIDDIYDEGVTLQALLDYCAAEGAREVYAAVLVNKLHARKTGSVPAFVGLEVVDRYVFGYGMDYKGYLRNIPGIYAVKGM
jgi:hypoxanthine phosphoribosyltransferase